MITGGPYTLSGGVSLSLSDPYAATGGSAASIQVQNQSGFVLSVVANGEVYTVQSFTAQTIALQTQGATITITPTSTISSGATNSLIVVWMVAGEKPDLPDGQLTAAAVAAAVSGVVSVAGDQATLAKLSDFPSVTLATGAGVVNINYDVSPAANVQGIRWDQTKTITVSTPGLVAGSYALVVTAIDLSSGYIYFEDSAETILSSGATDITFSYSRSSYIFPIAYTGGQIQLGFQLRGASLPAGTYSLMNNFSFTGLPIGYGLDGSFVSNYAGVPLADSVAPADTILPYAQSTTATQIYSVPEYGNGIIVRSLATLTDPCGISNGSADPFVYCPANDTRACNFYIPSGGAIWMVNGGSSGYIFVTYTTV